MAESQLVGTQPHRHREQLVPQAGGEDRHTTQQSPDGLYGISERSGIAGAVGEEHPVRAQGQRLFGREGGRYHGDPTPRLLKTAKSGASDAVVERHHVEAPLAGHPRLRRLPAFRHRGLVWVGRGDVLHQVAAGERPKAAHIRQKAVDIK